ncbi:hypothetical protein V6N13_102403 [Hibiscus sabdariffa]
MSLSLDHSSPGPTSLPATRKSLFMEKMKDKDIIRRAFKTFQSNYNQLKPSSQEQSTTAKPVPAKGRESSVPTLTTPQKENGGMDNNTKLFVLKYFHSEKFVSSPKFDYVNYKTEKFQVDPDRLCYWDIVGNMKELGYDNDAWLYFRVPGGIITEADENAVNEVVGNAVNDIDEHEHETVNEVGEKGTSQDPIGDEVADIEDLGNNTTEVEHEADEKETSQDFVEDEVPEIEDLGHSTAEVEQVAGEKETSQDSADFLVNVEIASDLDDEVERIRVNLRDDRHGSSTDFSEGEENNDVECGSQPNVGNDLFEEDEDVAEVEGKLQDHGSDYIEYDEPGEYGKSDDDFGDQICGAYMGRGKKQVGHKYDLKCAFPLWEFGLRFEDHKQFKEAVRKYAIAKGVALRFKKSEPKRVRVCCKVGCPWSLFASMDKRYDYFLVKTYNPVHKCVRTYKNPILTSKHIENVFRDRILADPSMKVETLKQHCRKELGLYASFNKCQRARLNVLREKRGSYIEEYATLWGYAAELLHSNPGSTVFIQVHRDSDNKVIFHRMYICFDALKKGELLVAIGRDGNNQMFPVAWVVVEGEGKESWKWFLTKLMQDLNHPDGEGNSKCDVVDNNLAEAFNGWIVDARCHPIIIMLEEIRKMASQSDNNARITRSMKRKFNETETIAVRSFVSNKKRQVGNDIYTDLRIGEQTLNPGLPSEQVVTRAAKRKIGASTSQYNHASKGPGLKWRGKQAVTTRQLQQQQSDQRRQSKRRTSQNPLHTQSSQTDANANN